MSGGKKARAVGINHVALEVGDIEDALAFYGQFLEFTLRSKSETMAFIDMGDQFLAMSKVDNQRKDNERHFGLVVDDKQAVIDIVEGLGISSVSDRFFDFYDPWGNRIEIVGYQGIQFSKTETVLSGMGLETLDKTDATKDEIAKKFGS